MDQAIQDYLQKLGYSVDNYALTILQQTNNWYTNQKIDDFHTATTINGESYDLERMNFAKTICSDDANLVEMVEINAQTNESSNNEMLKILSDNQFVAKYREQTEEMSANGTVGAYIRLENADIYEDGAFKNGKIRIEYCNALNILPLTVINNEIIEVAFASHKIVKQKSYNQLVLFQLHQGIYHATTVLLDQNGKEVDKQIVKLGEVKPFAIMRQAEVNNLKMKGYGYPKLWSAIPNLKVLDLTFTMWRRDLEKADKIVLINDKLARRDEKGNIIPPSKAMKQIFVQVGQEKLPNEGALYQEYNPSVRIEEVEASMELALSLLSMSFGYGTKKYTFEQGRILSATEYIGERQDTMQSVNKQREVSITYVKDIIKAIRWFSNEANGTNFADDEITVDFDDSYIEDKTAIAKQMREDALSFDSDTLKLWYFKKQYNLGDKEAMKLLNELPKNDDGTQLEE